MNQPSLFDPPRARRSDPDTSHASAAAIQAVAGEQFREILAALERPATARRLPEMEALHLVIPTKERRASPKGRPCRVWQRVRP